jgi:hypothetical protein
MKLKTFKTKTTKSSLGFGLLTTTTKDLLLTKQYQLYREATKIIEDGVELTKTYHRTSLTPGQDLTGQPAQVVAIANTVWTDEVIAAYQAQLQANQL